MNAGSGCTDFFDFLVPDGSLWTCAGGGIWSPPGYVYTDPSGTAYTMTASGQLQSIVDKSGNALTISPNGITSSTGLAVPFERDSKGRIFEERRYLVPKNGKFESQITIIQIADPHTHILYNCFQDSRKECVQLPYDGSTSVEYKVAGPPPGPLPDGIGTASHEELGKEFVEGVETVGTRDSVVYNPGIFGNDLRLTVEREYWYSPQLGISLLSIRSDPRIGKQTFRATELVLADPDPGRFELPKGFKAVVPTHPPLPEQSETNEQ